VSDKIIKVNSISLDVIDDVFGDYFGQLGSNENFDEDFEITEAHSKANPG
jgi:hypothetical protein